MKSNMYLVGYEGWDHFAELLVVIEDTPEAAVNEFLDAIDKGDHYVSNEYDGEPIYVNDITDPIVFEKHSTYLRRFA